MLCIVTNSRFAPKRRTLEMLEPDEEKFSCPVLRGLGVGNNPGYSVGERCCKASGLPDHTNHIVQKGKTMDELNFLYTEYVRLSSLVNSYAASSFSDFQLLGVVGAMLAWEPLANRLAKTQHNEQADVKIIFFGFVAIFFVVAIIATRDLMKQSIIIFEINQICLYEQAIRNLATFDLKNTFKSAIEWTFWINDVHEPISNHFRLLVIILATAFPAFVLWAKNRRYTYSYLAISGLLAIIFLHAAFILRDAVNTLECLTMP